MSLAFAAVALLAAATPPAVPAPAATPADLQAPTLRLPPGVVPLRGELDLAVDPASEHHSGVAHYVVRVDAPTKVIWLHAGEGMVIGRATVGGKLARAVKKGEFLALVLDAPVPAGTTKVDINFTGDIDRVRSRGLYAVAEGDWYAYTFFEPTDARRAFPAFDEPWAKIPWKLTLRVPPGNRAFANAPIASEQAFANEVRITFAETKPLPTYLVAFVVGPFEVVEAGTGGAAKVPVRFLVPKGRGAEAAYAASVTAGMIDRLEAATGVPYPYEKCDVAVVPRYWGTMEHPGIVALGQPLTLIRAEDDSRERRERYAYIAAHELAHLWFGDLVTMAWWDDTWLNESFGSWMDAPVTDAVNVAWRHLVSARADGRATALEADGNTSVKAIRQPVETVHDIEGAFDNATTYAKGSAVLAMFEAHVGQEPFRAATKRHLEARAHGSATTDDAVAAFSATLSPEVGAALRGWVERPGAPLVRLEVACGESRPRAVVMQERFLAAGGGGPGEWTIPLCVKYGAAKKEVGMACALVGGPRAELTLPYCPEWTWANGGGLGVYVSALPEKGLDALSRRLDLLEQLALAGDAKLLARRGDVPLDAALSLALALAPSKDRLEVEASLELLQLIEPASLTPRDRTRHRALLRTLFGSRARALGWLPREGDGDEVNALRHVVVRAASAGEDATLVDQARRLAFAWLDDRKAVPAEVSSAALGVAARSGDRKLFDRVLAEAAATNDRTERGRLLAALGAFRDPKLAAVARGLILPAAAADAAAFDVRETLPILRNQLAEPETSADAWKYLAARWDDLAGRIRGDEGQWLTVQAAELACEPGKRDEVAGFLVPRAEQFEGAPRALALALEDADACAAARQRNAPKVSAFLAKHGR